MVRLEVTNIQKSNNVIIHASHNAVTCLTSSQWCHCSFLVGTGNAGSIKMFLSPG